MKGGINIDLATNTGPAKKIFYKKISPSLEHLKNIDWHIPQPTKPIVPEE